jgi:hypothetical protein
MKKRGITFSELRQLLLDVGFRETPEKTRMRFVHPGLDHVMLFRLYRPKEIVQARDLVLVRWQLIHNGLIDEADLDRFLQKASA